MKRRGPLAFVGAVAGISLLAPYVLSAVSSRFPGSIFAKLNAGLHKGSA